MSTRSIYVDALVGALVTVLLGFVPLSPVLGGGVAGYLHGADGPRVGAISGVFAAIPAAVVAFLGLAFFAIVPAGGAGRSLLLFLGVALLVLLATAVYTVLLGALGGYLGVYIRTDREDRGDADGGSEAASGP